MFYFRHAHLLQALVLSLLTLSPIGVYAQSSETWRIRVGPSLQSEEAIRLATGDLVEAGKQLGLTLDVKADSAAANSILVGDGTRNEETARLLADGSLTLDPMEDPEGYQIKTLRTGETRTLVVAGGSVIGDAYGLYWILDRLRVYRRIPDLDVTRKPAMKVRFGAAWGRRGQGGSTKEQMHWSLRQGMNWVSGPNLLDLIPWDSEPEATLNRKNREDVKELIAYAHGLHMKYFSFSNDFTYHPSLL
ncbi:MAG: hypothetical protein WC655_15255, partial [Candidatus Hydrogenedentales bacterium]